MKEYVCSILLTVSGCHLLLRIITEIGGTNSRKMLRFLCGLVLLLTIFHPLQNCAETLQQALGSFSSLYADAAPLEDEQTNAVSASTYGYIAEKWISYMADEYAIPREEIRIIFHTDAGHMLTHAEIALKNCYYAQRQNIENDMNTQTEFPITVKGW